MTEERFIEILREYGISEKRIRHLWNNRPPNINLDEARVRWTTKRMIDLLKFTDT